jgi:hypothetical protein
MMKETGMMCSQRWDLMPLGNNPNFVFSNLASGLPDAGDGEKSVGWR